MSRIWTEVDLHIVAMLVLSVPVAFLSWWWLALPLVMPQGRIYFHAWDTRKSGGRAWPYVAANEILVMVTLARIIREGSEESLFGAGFRRLV